LAEPSPFSPAPWAPCPAPPEPASCPPCSTTSEPWAGASGWRRRASAEVRGWRRPWPSQPRCRGEGAHGAEQRGRRAARGAGGPRTRSQARMRTRTARGRRSPWAEARGSPRAVQRRPARCTWTAPPQADREVAWVTGAACLPPALHRSVAERGGLDNVTATPERPWPRDVRHRASMPPGRPAPGAVGCRASTSPTYGTVSAIGSPQPTRRDHHRAERSITP